MSKVMGAVTDGGRHRMRVVGALVAAVLAAGLVPWVGADTARPSGGGHGHGHDRGDDKLLFFAADGLRQDSVRKYADQGVVPGLPRPAAQRRARVRQRPADPGAAEHRRRLVHARHRRVAGRARLDEQHLPRQRPAVLRSQPPGPRRSTPACCRPRRSPRRPSAAARRSPRSSGPAGAAARSTARRSTSATSSPAAAWPRTTSRRPTTPRSRAVVRPAVRPPGRVRRPARRSRRRRPSPATGWTDVPALVQPGEGDAPARARRRRRQVRPQRLHLRQPQRRPHPLRPRPVLADQGRRRRGRRPARGRVGRRQGHDPGRRARTARPAPCWSRSSGSPPTSRRSACSTRR